MNKITSIITFFALSVTAWSFQGQRPSAFYVDFASFNSDSANFKVLEVYYQIYTSELLYIRKGEQYVANYGVSAVIKKDNKQVTATETEGFFYKETYEKTLNPEDFFINSFRFYLKPDKYKIKITLTDLNASTTLPLETELVLPDYKAKTPMFSAIEFVRDISDTGEPTRFDKNHWKLIPSCSRIYGDDNNQLRFYFEYYSNQKVGDTIQFTYEIRDNKDNIVASEMIGHKIIKHRGFVGEVSLEKLRPGVYDLIISTPAYQKNKVVSTRSSFNIAWSALAMVEYDVDTAIEQLRYIANPKELDELRNATSDQMIELWNAFWKSRDPSPGTEENELRDEYYRRIAYSNKNFSLAGKDGWKTDMGMIHIIHGEPDDIERHPFDIDTKPYELWYYYNPKRRFLFIDERGYGEYILQYPYDGDMNKPVDFREGWP